MKLSAKPMSPACSARCADVPVVQADRGARLRAAPWPKWARRSVGQLHVERAVLQARQQTEAPRARRQAREGRRTGRVMVRDGGGVHRVTKSVGCWRLAMNGTRLSAELAALASGCGDHAEAVISGMPKNARRALARLSGCERAADPWSAAAVRRDRRGRCGPSCSSVLLAALPFELEAKAVAPVDSAERRDVEHLARLAARGPNRARARSAGSSGARRRCC